MEAFKLKLAIEDLLEKHAAGRYAVISPRRKSEAVGIFDCPQVQVFYSSGDIDKSKSSINSPYHHNCSFDIYIRAAAKVKVNTKILEDPAATDAQRAEALAAGDNASVAVDKKTDEMMDIIFNIIMRPEHRNLGTDYNPNRWITSLKKSNPESLGAIVMESATITLTAQ